MKDETAEKWLLGATSWGFSLLSGLGWIQTLLDPRMEWVLLGISSTIITMVVERRRKMLKE